MPKVDTVTGELIAHRVVGQDFWSIATVRTAKTGLVPVVGKLLGAQLGDTVCIEGTWTEHPKFGNQFKAASCEVTVPQTDNGVVAWLSSRLPNVGAGRARTLLAHFGGAEGLWKAIEATPDRLSEVKGITPERGTQIVEAYARFRHDRDRMILFRRWGMTEYQIGKMLTHWGDDSEARLRKNPYELSRVVDGFGFLRADAIAQRMGVPKTSVPRIECGLYHTMEQAAGHGHCYVATGKLVAMAANKVLRLPEDTVRVELIKMRKRGEFVQHGARVFARHLNEFEQRCADAIRALLDQDTVIREVE